MNKTPNKTLLYLILMILFCCVDSQVFAQTQDNKEKETSTNQVVSIELKNGSFLTGLIINQNNKSILLDIGEGDNIDIPMNGIKNINYNIRKGYNDNKFYNDDFRAKKNTFYHISQVGILVNQHPFEQQSWSLGFVNGFQFIPQLSVGLGINMNKIDQYLFTPIFIELRGNLLGKHRVSPSYFASIGNGYLVNKNDLNTDRYTETGGLFYEYGIGLKIKISDKLAYLLSISSQSQMYKDRLYIFSSGVGQGDWWQETELEYRRINVKMGINF